MNWPIPVPGMVVRYSFLWSSEDTRGREESTKNRPCAIVVAMGQVETGIRTYLLPITHTPPQIPGNAMEIPKSVKVHLGLDGDPSWIVLNEINAFVWPGYDLAPVARSGSPVYGILPPGFFRLLRSRFLAVRNRTVTKRT
jgi:hypothetical protein